jgi:tetratricopeptide (TPR) repeat protein
MAVPSVAVGFLVIGAGIAHTQPAADGAGAGQIRIVELQGAVEVIPYGRQNWKAARTNDVLKPFDRLRTGDNSRVGVSWPGQSVIRFGPLTELEVLPPRSSDSQSGLHLVRGILSFFHRDQPGRIQVITRGAVAGVEGTEFVMAVALSKTSETTTLSVIDGRVQFGNEQATLLLTNGQQAIAEPGRAPERQPGFIVNNLVQWCLYYPAVLNPDELPLTQEEKNQLADSLAAYRTGDLLEALAKHTTAPSTGSDSRKVYYAALLLSVGQAEQAEAILSSLAGDDPAARPERVAAALRQLVAAVKRQPAVPAVRPQLATELLAASYYEQSRAVRNQSLETALALAKEAAQRSPDSGFAWTRVAELEFSFGLTRDAAAALDKGLALAPRNAQTLALKGYLLAAHNQTREAVAWFDRALAVDSALANAWLGRGLCRIRLGDAAGGREDLLIAAALEPQRAGLRSYLGKAYGDAGDHARATNELQLAQRLDPRDPTAWLYSALLNQQNNRINEAIGDLEESQALNDNRSVYRSQLLLDQDQAVRSANLASVYRDAGMFDVAVREAGRAVNSDYANYSAHLFLANSYVAQRDPNLSNLRYETASENEYLLAMLLAPVSAGTISPAVSQEEYGALFQRDGFGVVSSTEYLSRGAWTQSGAQYGTFGNFGYSFDAYYRNDPGQWANGDTEQRQLSLTLKQQLTPQDTVVVQVKQYEADSGDIYQHYDPATANPAARVHESQEPIVGIGYHHEWSPGVQTLFFATRLQDRLSVTNPTAPSLLAIRPDLGAGPELVALYNVQLHEKLVDELEVYSGELQQVWQQAEHNTIVGGRAEYGNIDMNNRQIDPLPPFTTFFPTPPTNSADQHLSSSIKRFSVYGYHQWQVADPLQLIGGLSYDWLSFPENFLSAPLSDKEQTVNGFSPKAGLIWTPLTATTARFAYTRSLSGATFDTSYQLEPSQVAGFVQSFRSVIPESVAGPNAGATVQAFNLSLEQKFPTRTYLGAAAQLLKSDLHRTVGAFDSLDTEDFAIPSSLRQHLDFKEQSLLLTANQLVGRDWSFGAGYRLTYAVLEQNFQNVPDPLPFSNANSPAVRERQDATLNQLSLFAVYNHPSGFFAKAEAVWYSQVNRGYSPAEPGDHFWQLNALMGYRFWHRKAEATIGVLNITDRDYHLNPLNIYDNLPRERTLAVRFRLNF